MFFPSISPVSYRGRYVPSSSPNHVRRVNDVSSAARLLPEVVTTGYSTLKQVFPTYRPPWALSWDSFHFVFLGGNPHDGGKLTWSPVPLPIRWAMVLTDPVLNVWTLALTAVFGPKLRSPPLNPLQSRPTGTINWDSLKD